MNDHTIDFSETYSTYYRRLYRISYSITRDVHLAEDVVHDAFIKAMAKAGTMEDETKIGAWLSVITGRMAIDVLRRERKKKGVLMEQEMIDCLGKVMKQNVEEEVETAFFEEEIHTAISKLGHEYRDVLILKVDHGLKEREIATALDLNPSTVKTRIYRARKQLKHLFLEQNEKVQLIS
ncbi:RNA polymerase sigma factor [Evansella tamaricis]|uniref:RNA polymerase sigma factor n=1 Tax=Evansella tamaricis TaxID=2069301 RepID=A0ABS6JAK8_9BACI|nr:RNA polymerase sigma factor [Evansella tamaricis]MBU9710214.1 RNA polymerase sigma factor [Evansella tamaricis]